MAQAEETPLFRIRIPLVLASASPRRHDFLASLGLRFRVFPAPGNSEPQPRSGEFPAEYAARAASAKALAVRDLLEQEPAGRETAIIGADTVVVLDGQILGKPADKAEALCYLKRLSGREHQVISAVSLVLPNKDEERFSVTTRVVMHSWPEALLASYVATGEPLDKAGAYAIQGRGAFLADAVIGSWSAVVGLPLAELVALLIRKEAISPCR